MWDLIVSVPDHCLSFYFESTATRIMLDTYFYKLRCQRPRILIHRCCVFYYVSFPNLLILIE